MIQVYIKPFCPYCIRLLELLDQKNISYEKTDIIADSGMAQVMREKSGQTGVPEVEIANVIIPDYVTEETLVEDIQKILAVGNVGENLLKDLTSTIVYLPVGIS